MRFWLTTHPPHLRPEDDARWNVYLRRRPTDFEPARGDPVLFYETLAGPRGVGRGRQAIVRAAEVAGPVQSSDEDGWPLMYPCHAHRPAVTLIPRSRVLAELGRGSMCLHAGLLEINAEQYDRFRAAMFAPSPAAAASRSARPSSPASRHHRTSGGRGRV